MRTLLEAVTKFSFANPDQKPGDQVRGTDKAKTTGNQHPFKGRLVGGESVDHDDDTLEESLMYEYKIFVEADPLVSNVSAQGTTTGTAQQPAGQQPGTTAQNPQQPQQPGQQAPQQNTAQTAADLAQTKSDLTSNLPQIKSFANQNSDDPQLQQMNIPKTVDALTKDPSKLTPTDGQSLAKLAGIVKPALSKSTGVSQLKNVLRTQQNQGQQ